MILRDDAPSTSLNISRKSIENLALASIPLTSRPVRCSVPFVYQLFTLCIVDAEALTKALKSWGSELVTGHIGP
jgi:hypothetical protein